MPEKLTNEIARPLRDLCDKGVEALKRNNLDYALTIFCDVLKKDPAYFECRQALREAQAKKSGGKGGFFKKVINTANPNVVKAQALLKSKPAEAMAAVEQALNADANNPSAHRTLAEAALAMGLTKTAVLSLEIARREQPKDKEICMALSRAYAANQQMPQAEAVLAELLRANPNDSEISKTLKNLSADRTMDEGGYDKILTGESTSYRDMLKNADESVKLEKEARGFKDEKTAAELLDQKVDELRENPSDLRLAREVADLYEQVKDYDKALKYYLMLSEIPEVNDASISKKIASLQVKVFDQRLEALDPASPEYEASRDQIQAEKDEYLLQDVEQRAAKYPNDNGIRYELGVMYFKTGKVAEAIQELQKAQRDPSRRISAMYYLALCFSKRNMYDLAVKTLSNALAEKPNMDEEKKDMIYQLGVILDNQGKKKEAIEQFTLIYETDISYRDVGARVDAFYAEGGA